MFFYDDKIPNPKSAPNWFTNIKVIEITPNSGVSGTGPFNENFKRRIQVNETESVP